MYLINYNETILSFNINTYFSLHNSLKSFVNKLFPGSLLSPSSKRPSFEDFSLSFTSAVGFLAKKIH